MAEQKIVTASLEGMRILVDQNQCELQEYNYAHNHWVSKDVAAWPLPIKHEGGEELLFKVTWTIHDKNGQSGSIFVINSFSLPNPPEAPQVTESHS